ncbi:unnamed protein product [Caenorhabditis auriculariae]|uniref:ATP-dependent RNA helicase n=1 Tax=Caenorhabditis auriculariae TaxID=2777116 RepID=A0A8S1GX01_9PELO|nr:unnamed protein product [Caenorhabditis auriculariae]
MASGESKFGSVAQRTFRERLSREILEVFDQSFKKFTDVQVLSGTHLLNHSDVVVESPTGSGKTLSFLLPLFTILQKKKLQKNEIGALILSPSRELATQISKVALPYAEKLGLTVRTSTGGNKIEKDLKNFKEGSANILIATPGRLYSMLEAERAHLVRCFRSLEVLIVDEADRFSESQFEVALKDILASLPKQRRTGLFSATQTKQYDEMASFGLRNAKKVKVTHSEETVVPSSLNNFYTSCETSEKTLRCLEFIRQRPDKKFLIFYPSCSAVQYFHQIFTRCLTKRPLFRVFGKGLNVSQRATQIQKFSESSNGVMLSTDVMARGIDISDIDWVIQFELPKLSSWFIHRAGRTARCGREGNALIIIGTEQLAYVNFVSQHEKVALKEISVPTSSARKAEELRQKMIKIQCSDRAILEAGTRAFVSHIEAYVKHDCNIVFFIDLDVVGLANSYGLLRLPKMRELAQRKDLEKFDRSSIETSTIKYADPKLEAGRESAMEEKHERKVSVLAEKAKKEKLKLAKKNKHKEQTKAPKRKADDSGDDIHSDIRLMKKIKKGKLSKQEIKNVLN